MASQKDKLLESAQKFILKGQLDKAIRDYQQIVAIDPKYRQKLAELLVRAGNREAAIAEYDIIAKGYADTFFFLKAIAVYKQIQKLDPDAIRINNNLATLYEKQGLIANALAEYRTVYEYFERKNQPDEAIKILEKMQEIEPENPPVLLKLAEMRYQTDQKEMAYHEFKQLALLLRSKGDEDAFAGVCGRIGQLFPDKRDLVLELLSAEIERGKAVAAIHTLQGMLRRDPTNLKVLTLLVTAFRAIGDLKNRKIAYQHILRHYPAEFLPKEGLVECAVQEGDLETALTLLHDNAADFIARGRQETLEGFYLQLRSTAPDDPRIIEGLFSLYEADGQPEKAEAMSLLLRQLQGGGVGEYDGVVERIEEGPEPVETEPPVVASTDLPPDTGEEPVVVEDIPVVADDVVTVPDEVVTAEILPSSSWEEEIILNLPEDDPVRFMQQGSGAELDVDGPPEAELAGLPEVELEIDEAVMDEIVGASGSDGFGDDDLSGASPAGEGFVEVGFDFDDSELDFLDNPDLASSSAAGEDGEIIYTFDELLSKFKEGVDRQLDRSDTENHFNLGIAYKEMGLLDEAIAEFRIASADPQRQVACLTLEGICSRDKGDFAHAENLFFEAGALDVLTAEEVLSLSYELAVLYEASSRPDEAIGIYHEIWKQRPDYRDVKDKVKHADRGDGDMEVIGDLEIIDLESEEG